MMEDSSMRKPDPNRPTAGAVQPSSGKRSGFTPEPADVGVQQRDYAVSSGDRNTKASERDWPGFQGGTQRTAAPDAPRDPPKRPRGA
jgi:hypothetical protein